jgi:hypothetical protein
MWLISSRSSEDLERAVNRTGMCRSSGLGESQCHPREMVALSPRLTNNSLGKMSIKKTSNAQLDTHPITTQDNPQVGQQLEERLHRPQLEVE